METIALAKRRPLWAVLAAIAVALFTLSCLKLFKVSESRNQTLSKSIHQFVSSVAISNRLHTSVSEKSSPLLGPGFPAASKQ